MSFQEELEAILDEMSYKQWELGSKGLIPLSKNTQEAKQKIIKAFNEKVIDNSPLVITEAYPSGDDVESITIDSLKNRLNK